MPDGSSLLHFRLMTALPQQEKHSCYGNQCFFPVHYKNSDQSVLAQSLKGW
ncbi:hypothetical protein SynBIOSE41_01480 [Synechococcus sp. BIOS-E4-1]|nr:hypothetical protein SynBIOSE41_01480 [Synechococcus sp. BIOS-E4-1]